jgi:hypothetical protein
MKKIFSILAALLLAAQTMLPNATFIYAANPEAEPSNGTEEQ